MSHLFILNRRVHKLKNTIQKCQFKIVHLKAHVHQNLGKSSLIQIGDGPIKLVIINQIVILEMNGILHYVVQLTLVLKIVPLMEFHKNKMETLIQFQAQVKNLLLVLLLKDLIQEMLVQEYIY